MLDAVRAATDGTPQEVVAQVAHTVQGMARRGKDMADVKYEVHKLMNKRRSRSSKTARRVRGGEVGSSQVGRASSLHPRGGGGLEKREGRSDRSKN